jgi:D-alanine-D-alanine ligase
MKKKKVAILFGGKSGEHEVSIVSAGSVYKALDKNKYEVTMIGIDKTGRWLLPSESERLASQQNPRLTELNKMNQTMSLVPFQSKNQIVPIDGSSATAQNFDVIIPILHGTYGEDGTIQGLLELANIPYVGSGVLGSALGMDKDAAKRIWAQAKIPVVPWMTVRRHDFSKNSEKILAEIHKNFPYPYFAKPANMGSSVGVHKIKSSQDELEKIRDAFLYDTKILIEKGIDARELEVSVLGNYEPKASVVGEIIPTHEFYSYESKYIDENGAHLKIPAENLKPEQITHIQKMAIDAFKAIECRGMGRVDFFLDRITGQLYLNEINTIPGFTSISMYPKLWEAAGLKYADLLDELIRLAFERHEEKNSLKTTFESPK